MLQVPVELRCIITKIYGSYNSRTGLLYTAYDNESNELRLFDADSGTIVASLPSSFGQISGDCTLSKDESTGFSSNAGRNISVFNFSDAALGNGVDVTSIEISNAGVDYVT